MTIWMQDRSVEIIGDSADIFAEAYTLAVQYLPLLSGPKQSSDTSNTTAEMKAAKLHDLFSRCSVEFNRGKQIEAACAAAADYVPDPSVPDTHQQEFLAANASLDLLIHQHHARHEPDRQVQHRTPKSIPVRHQSRGLPTPGDNCNRRRPYPHPEGLQACTP